MPHLLSLLKDYTEPSGIIESNKIHNEQGQIDDSKETHVEIRERRQSQRIVEERRESQSELERTESTDMDADADSEIFIVRNLLFLWNEIDKRTPWIIAQCQPMPIKKCVIDHNVDQCWSMPINVNQGRIWSILLMPWCSIDRHWSALIGIDWHWEAFWNIAMISIGIGHWSGESCKRIWSSRKSTTRKTTYAHLSLVL